MISREAWYREADERQLRELERSGDPQALFNYLTRLPQEVELGNQALWEEVFELLEKRPEAPLWLFQAYWNHYTASDYTAVPYKMLEATPEEALPKVTFEWLYQVDLEDYEVGSLIEQNVDRGSYLIESKTHTRNNEEIAQQTSLRDLVKSMRLMSTSGGWMVEPDGTTLSAWVYSGHTDTLTEEHEQETGPLPEGVAFNEINYVSVLRIDGVSPSFDFFPQLQEWANGR